MAASGTDPEKLILDLVDALPKGPQTWGARVIEKWRQSGVIGSYGNMSKDSPEYARDLRSRVEADLFPRPTDVA